MDEDEDMVDESAEEEEEEEEPPPPPAPRLRTKAPPPKNYQRVRIKDVNFDELRKARGRVVYRFMVGVMLTIFGIFCLVRFAVFQNPMPWKVTDPSSAQFKVKAFKFTDYQTPAKVGVALQILLPAGTPKQLVDQLLARIGHAQVALLPPKKNLPPNERQFSYIYQEERTLTADLISYFAVSHDNVRRWIVIVTYASPSAQVLRMTVAMDTVQPVTEAYTNISPQSMDSTYWQ